MLLVHVGFWICKRITYSGGGLYAHNSGSVPRIQVEVTSIGYSRRLLRAKSQVS